MVFYLKLNRCIDYSIKNLQAWINIIVLLDEAIIYILCDNEKLNKRIGEEIDFKGVKHSYIKSNRSDAYLDLVNAISVKNWHNAAYAHMTPFIHAKNNGYVEYWNIDADDTLFCLQPERVKEILEEVHIYANLNKIDLFSLDMWRSRAHAMHWSFGITYINGNVDWIEIMKKYMSYENSSIYFMNGNHAKNIDEYFTYIKSKEKSIKIETFYVENLLFVHYSDDVIMNPITSGVFRWKEQKLTFPIIKSVYGIDSLGEVDIANDVIKFDVGIKDYEGGWALAQMSPFSIETINIIEAEEYEAYREKIMNDSIQARVEQNMLRITEAKEVFIFGIGKYTSQLIDILRNGGVDPIAILDNAEFKWGWLINLLYVCDPKKIKEVENIDETCVLIAVRHHKEIKQQLLNYGIKEQNILIAVDYARMD